MMLTRCAIALTMCLTALGTLVGGCASDSETRWMQTRENSYGIQGEIVEAELLNVDEYRAALTELTLDVHPDLSFDQPTFVDIGIGQVVGKLIELGGKWIQGELEKEAERHRQQFAASAFQDGFWGTSSTAPDGTEPTIVGLRIRRYTDKLPRGGTEGAAFDFLAALKLSGDQNFLIIHPLYLKDQFAKAKIRGDKLQLELQIEQTGYWVDAGGVLKTTTLAVATKKLTVPLGKKPLLWNCVLRGQPKPRQSLVMWGALAAPPLSANAAKGRASGILQLLCTATETDQTKAAEYFRKAAKLVEEKTPEVSQAIRERVEKALDKAEDPATATPPPSPTPSPTPNPAPPAPRPTPAPEPTPPSSGG